MKTVDVGRDQASRVRFVDLPSPFDVWEHGHQQRLGPGDYFVGQPREVCENSGQGLDVPTIDCSIFAGPTRTFWAAPLGCDPVDVHYMDWHGWCDNGTCVNGVKPGASCSVDDDCVEVIHLYHEGLVPSGVYDVQVIDSNCSLQDEGSYSDPLTMIQSVWGDVCGPGSGGACSAVADGVVDVTNDVLGVLDKVANLNDLQKARADIAPREPDFIVDVPNDVLYCLEAFTGDPYPFAPGDPCAPGLSREGD
jgi:hypothetical protein